MHNNAQVAAEASECANAQGKFWEYHDKLFANQRALDATNLKQYAKDVGLDEQAFATCLDEHRFQADVNEQHRLGSSLGVTGTPAFFINGRFLSGAQPYGSFSAIIDDELERKRVKKSDAVELP